MTPREIIQVCADAAGTGFCNASQLIYSFGWPKDPREFRKKWNEREVGRFWKKVDGIAEKREKAKQCWAKYYASISAEEKLACSQRKRTLAKQRGVAWLKYTYKKKNPEAVLAHRHRQRVRNTLNGTYWGKTKASELLGCSVQFFKQYIEARFKPGMTWDNKDKWHIDHYIPIDSFDMSKACEVKKAFHFSNCVPEWAVKNQQKFYKMPERQTELAIA